MVHVDRILIVGGGIAGLSLAIALRRRGFSPVLIERETQWKATGAGISIQPNGMRVLRALGLSDAVSSVGAVADGMSFCDRQDRELAGIDVEELWGGIGPCIGIERSKLLGSLLSGSSDVEKRLGTSVTTLTAVADGVRVQFDDGSIGFFDLVVGADGISSIVRALVSRDTAPVYGGQMVWRSIVQLPSGGPSDIRFLLGDGCFFGLCPVGDGRTYGFANVTGPRLEDPVQGRLERLRDRFSTFGGYVPEYLAALDRDELIHCSAVEWLDRETWGTGRIALIGDAAHAGSPMMGQGGSMAIEDAYVLAETLGDANDLDEALDVFVRRRAPRVGWVRRESLTATASLSLPEAARNGVLRERGRAMLRARYAPLVGSP